ncbi:MEDIATOR OF RNA polymerase II TRANSCRIPTION SUBUNIT-RELATED [Salix purpurea]|uniref:MEDIATOR OF RNA polymerase II TRANSCRIPTION SUBUNIT-RELATED n=1 Tax=Salix purpurea TaxID=77065 RepID=A0A9Q0QGU7_SALPP|nr:MEDIATOR OF RNA polymerase II TRANSCRIPTION SUBUNIT-RELATED [Salix purpurea]
MDHSFSGGGNWTMIPTVQGLQAPSGSPAHSNQDQFYLPPPQQQPQFTQFQQQQQFNQQQQQFQQQQQYQQPQPQQQRFIQQQPQVQPQNHHHQSLASHFHLLHLVENLADAIENGTRDQHSDALVNELNTQFDKCQHLLNSISSSINAKAMTVEGQKRKLEESEQLLNQRRELIGKYRNSVEELLKAEP